MNKKNINIFWFRRDLRLSDNTALHEANLNDNQLLHVFIFDKNILGELESGDFRVNFIHQEVMKLKTEIEVNGGALHVFYGDPKQIWTQLISEYNIDKVFYNRDYEPYAKQRDSTVNELLRNSNITPEVSKDHVIFESHEVLKKDQTPYTVFTPYKNQWLPKFMQWKKNYKLKEPHIKNCDIEKMKMPSLLEMGFIEVDFDFPERTIKSGVINNYDKTRDYPAVDGTSRLGIHFRFGTISIREKALKADGLNETYLSELIWRDFYSMILDVFPHVQYSCYREKYNNIPWLNNLDDIESWKRGETGYPLVDAGMRELNNTGHMHNRVRMVTASFLTKHLLVDWRIGEAYFAMKLLDFDMASNNGGWQWAAGCGTDAAPYFRIFNPTSQLKKFDKDFKYVKKWVPEWGTPKYPEPIVEHKMARERCLRVYKDTLNS